MFKLKANPTFTSKVKIARADGETGEIEIEFRHKTTDETNEFLRRTDSGKTRPVEWAKEIIVSWSGVDAEFSEAALGELLQEHFSAAEAIMSGYLRGLSGGRLGN